MSHLFGPVRQIGYVVRDIESAIDFWSNTMGCGPVYYFRCVRLENHTFRGVRSAPEFALALVQNGDIQVELIQPSNDAVSSYSAFLEEHGEGMHHLGYWTDRFDADLERAERHGMVVEQYADCRHVQGLAERLVCFAPAGHPGTVIELAEVRHGGAGAAFFRSVAEDSKNWNGIAPIRLVGGA